jgi:hypothetical protein
VGLIFVRKIKIAKNWGEERRGRKEGGRYPDSRITNSTSK